MTTPEQALAGHAAVKDLGRGVVLVTIDGRPSDIAADILKQDARRIEHREAEAIVRTPEGHGQHVLLAPTQVLITRGTLLSRIGPELLEDIGGARRFADPETAMLDLQWRLNLLGHTVTAEEGPLPDRWRTTIRTEQLMRWRGTLTMLDTNLAMPLRGQLLAAAQLVAIPGALHASGTDTSALDLQRSPGGDEIGTMQVPTDGLVGAYALDSALSDLSETKGIRNTLQETRRIPRRLLLPLLREALPHLLAPTGADPAPALTTASLLGIDASLNERLHVLVIHSDSDTAAGRVLALAETLGDSVHLRLADAAVEKVSDGDEEIPGWTPDHIPWADALILEGVTLDDAPGAAASDIPLVADLSTMDVTGWLMNGPRTKYRSQALDDLLTRADLVLAGDSVQRDVLLGALAGTERINADVYDDDPSLGSLISVDPGGTVLERFCRRPVRSADAAASAFPVTPPRPSDLAVTLQYLRDGGISMVASKAMGRIRRVHNESNGKDD